jgi:hypothetical protein
MVTTLFIQLLFQCNVYSSLAKFLQAGKLLIAKSQLTNYAKSKLFEFWAFSKILNQHILDMDAHQQEYMNYLKIEADIIHYFIKNKNKITRKHSIITEKKIRIMFYL